METAVASDPYCKWINTNAFSWTPHNMTTYYENIKFLMTFAKSNIFGIILNAQNMQETDLNHFVWI